MAKSILHSRYVTALLILMSFAGLVDEIRAGAPQEEAKTGSHITHLSLEQLGNIEVTTESKEPVKAMRIPAAIFVITQEDIRRC